MVFLALTACVTKSVAATCTVDGAKHLSVDASASEICLSFEKRLDQALADGGKKADSKDVTIAIELHKRGSAVARVIGQSEEGPIEYPVVSVDVMDRPLMQKDLDSLADAVAQQLMKK
jgi:hypothetical protein